MGQACKILLYLKLGFYGLNGWKSRWVKNWLDGWTLRVMVNQMLYLEAASKWGTGICHGTCRVSHLYLSVTWNRWQSALFSCAEDAKLRGTSWCPWGKAATKRKPDRLGKQANRNLLKLNMGKSDSCPWEGRDPCRSTGWGLPAALLPRGTWEPFRSSWWTVRWTWPYRVLPARLIYGSTACRLRSDNCSLLISVEATSEHYLQFSSWI